GILIGRSITERPDLFAAAVDGVPCSDMLREETGANGPANIPEFGTVKEPDGFKALFEMAAYEHVVPGTKYPATLVTAGANDPRVDPWEGRAPRWPRACKPPCWTQPHPLPCELRCWTRYHRYHRPTGLGLDRHIHLFPVELREPRFSARCP